jgi:hypothetical protein
MKKKGFMPEQIIAKLWEAEALLIKSHVTAAKKRNKSNYAVTNASISCNWSTVVASFRCIVRDSNRQDGAVPWL